MFEEEWELQTTPKVEGRARAASLTVHGTATAEQRPRLKEQQLTAQLREREKFRKVGEIPFSCRLPPVKKFVLSALLKASISTLSSHVLLSLHFVVTLLLFWACYVNYLSVLPQE